MEISKEHTEKIKSDFMKMQTTQDLLELINFVNILLFGTHVKSYKLSQITYYSIPRFLRKKIFSKTKKSNSLHDYHVFMIKKKSGGERTIHAPSIRLRNIQKIIAIILQCLFIPNNAANGFVRYKSIVDNANVHVGNYYVYNIDLKDFFQSIDQARVWKCLQLKPFYLHSDFEIQQDFEKIKISRQTDSILQSKDIPNKINKSNRLKLANIIANIACVEMEVERLNTEGVFEKVKKDVLPQGAPTSPVLTNVVCQRLDYLLTAVAKRFGLKYSRYADDITFSSLHNVFQKDSPFLKELGRVILDQGFSIKESKTRLQVNGIRKEVTGLVVNEKVNVHKRYIKQIRMWIYYWEQYGYVKASDLFLKDYQKDKGHNPVKKNISLKQVLGGKLNFLKMVKGSDDKTYLKLKDRFEILAEELKKTKKLEYLKELEKRYVYLSKQISQETEKEKDDPIALFNDLLQKQELKDLERKLKINIKPKKKQIITDSNDLPIYHNPRKLVSLLNKFSKNENALKYTTHSWDAGRDHKKFKDINEFLEVAKEEYNKYATDLTTLNEPLNALIFNFVFNPNVEKHGWGDTAPKERIRFGWSSPELIKACNSDLSLNPEDFILPVKYQMVKNGVTIQKFKQVIDYFKNQIEIRDENSALLELILAKHDKYLGQENFEIHEIATLENKTFYTNVQYFSKALDYIFSSILAYKQHPNVAYSMKSEDDVYILEILHIGSLNEFKSIRDKKLNIDGGDFGSIAGYLHNLCDWSIESKFKEGPYRINFLTSDVNVNVYEQIDHAEGFKYILKFYK